MANGGRTLWLLGQKHQLRRRALFFQLTLSHRRSHELLQHNGDFDFGRNNKTACDFRWF